MALRYSCGLAREADLIEGAIVGALARGLRTGDIMQPNMRRVGTSEMGKAILAEIEKLAS
jgi:3-isopropylmalate dehydrogenase